MDRSLQSSTTDAPLPEWSSAELNEYTLHRRFDRMGRLVGDPAMARLAQTHVMVIGLGGVGSWSAEAIARSGVGKISIVDFDQICITNTNRQLHALTGLVGKEKSSVMAERLRLINPAATVHEVKKFFNQESAEEIFASAPDLIIDAIDSITAKCFLLSLAVKKNIPIICATGSGGRLDPQQIKVSDLAFTEVDPLAHEVRRILREKYGFTREKRKGFGIPAIYSSEPPRKPLELSYDKGKGFRCVCPQGDNPYFTCDNRNLIFGNASFVTGAFGLAAASLAVRIILGESDYGSAAQ